MKFGFLKTCDKLILLDNIICKGNTGNAYQISKKLKVSERCVYEYIELLKELGAEICFDRMRNTYYYLNDSMLKLKFN